MHKGVFPARRLTFCSYDVANGDFCSTGAARSEPHITATPKLPVSEQGIARPMPFASRASVALRPRRPEFVVYLLETIASGLLEGRLSRRKPRNRHPIRRARHIIETRGFEKRDRGRVATMLAAHTELKVRPG